MTFDLMVDLETMGTGPRAAIVQIGWCLFDEGGVRSTESRCVHLASSLGYGLEVDADTILWWMSQSQEARDLVFVRDVSGSAADKVELSSVLHDLRNVIVDKKVNRLWAKPMSFDRVILESAYRAIGYNIMPWDHRAWRDVRTLLEQAKEIKEYLPEIPHNAGSDAKAQALTVVDALAYLRSKS